jgi:hypothetical protein
VAGKLDLYLVCSLFLHLPGLPLPFGRWLFLSEISCLIPCIRPATSIFTFSFSNWKIKHGKFERRCLERTRRARLRGALTLTLWRGIPNSVEYFGSKGGKKKGCRTPWFSSNCQIHARSEKKCFLCSKVTEEMKATKKADDEVPQVLFRCLPLTCVGSIFWFASYLAKSCLDFKRAQLIPSVLLHLALLALLGPHWSSFIIPATLNIWWFEACPCIGAREPGQGHDCDDERARTHEIQVHHLAPFQLSKDDMLE